MSQALFISQSGLGMLYKPIKRIHDMAFIFFRQLLNSNHFIPWSVSSQTIYPEGRYEYSSGKYQYNLKDHLGNVRVMIDKNTATTSTAVQENEYYAFGLNVNRTSISPDNKYLYNGKEMQDDYGLNQYDYGARFYDPVVARWNVIDNKAEKYQVISPYVYAVNNPIIFIDPDGEDIVWFNQAGIE